MSMSRPKDAEFGIISFSVHLMWEDTLGKEENGLRVILRKAFIEREFMDSWYLTL